MTSSRDTLDQIVVMSSSWFRTLPVHDPVKLVGLALQVQRLSAQIFPGEGLGLQRGHDLIEFHPCLQTAGAERS